MSKDLNHLTIKELYELKEALEMTLEDMKSLENRPEMGIAITEDKLADVELEIIGQQEYL